MTKHRRPVGLNDGGSVVAIARIIVGAKSKVAGIPHRLWRPELEVGSNVVHLNAVNDDGRSGRIITKKEGVIREKHGWSCDGKSVFLADLGGWRTEVVGIVIIR